VRFLLIPVVVGVLILGVWVTGGLITNDFTAAMLLSALWMGFAGLIAVGIAVRWPRLRLPVLAPYLVTALVIGAYLASETFIEDTVDENVAAAGEAPAARGETRNEMLARGRFESVAHPTRGTATTIELARGGRVLTLTGFETDPGPDLRVYLVAGQARGEGDVDDFIDLGGLKGNQGDQQYKLPADADLRRHTTVVIWCRAFSVSFGRAPLRS